MNHARASIRRLRLDAEAAPLLSRSRPASPSRRYRESMESFPLTADAASPMALAAPVAVKCSWSRSLRNSSNSAALKTGWRARLVEMHRTRDGLTETRRAPVRAAGVPDERTRRARLVCRLKSMALGG